MKLDLATLQAAYQSGALTPRQLCAQILQRIQACENPNIWIHQLSEAELEPYLVRLEQADASQLPLYGIPFAIKDNIDLAGVPTTAACVEFAYTPEESATVVAQLIAAGAIPIGKTNLDQFATGLVGVRTPYGAPRNPLAPERVPGGSSCGSAVALSERLVSFSLGTDTAGSGRVPAMFNKLWGVKPSRGRLSNSGLVPACKTLDCISIFALNASDSLAVLRIAEGYDVEDAYSQVTRDLPLAASNMIGIPQADQLLFFGDVDYRGAWSAAVDQLQQLGWEVVEIDFEPFLQAARLLYQGPWVSERYTVLQDFITAQPQAFFPATLNIIAGGADHSAGDAFAATYKLADLRRESEAVWEGLAAIVTPTAGGFPKLTDLAADPIGPNSQLGYYTNFMNLLDLCAVAVPAGESAEGLPFGITWIAPRDRDRNLIEVAARGPAALPEPDTLSVLLFGAHMHGLPLNSQVQALGGVFVGPVQTAPKYKMIYLPEPAPHRPGIIRQSDGGVSLAAEEWCFPITSLGALLASIQQPLGLGQLELADGRKVHGFLCEAAAATGATDISNAGGWRQFLVLTPSALGL
jgi:allophanate hydrolase